MFSALDQAAISKILADCRAQRVKPGRMIFGPMQAADRFFLVLSGKVKVFKLSARGDEQILHLCGPGDTFGEAAMFAGGNYPACAEALEDSELLVITRGCLHRAISENVELAIGMIAGLSAKLREFNRLIEELSLKEVPARLAGVLLEMSDRAGSVAFDLQQTKRQLAAQIGTVAETLSRALSKLKAAGLIDVKGRRITLVDADALKDLAESG